MFHDIVLKHVDACGNVHVFQNRFFEEAPTIAMFIDFHESEGKSGMDDRDGGERSALPMLREHGLESEVCDLVSVKGEESLILNVTAYCQSEALACSSRYGMDAILDSHPKAGSVSK